MQIKVGVKQVGAYLLVLAVCFGLGYLLGYAFSHWF